MDVVTVIIPVLGRPARVEPLLASLYGSQRDAGLRPVFCVSPFDEEQEKAVQASDADWMLMPFSRGNGDYARKINRAARQYHDDSDWFFLAADDLCFCAGWADEAISVATEVGVPVVGTNDLGNPQVMIGNHATHSLVRSDYILTGTIDEPGKLLHEGYAHNWVDNEFVETARSRGSYVFAASSWVEHLHPDWGKGERDLTYDIGRAEYGPDHSRFVRRSALWA